MNLIKNILGILAFLLVPICGLVFADDCFDTIIDENGRILYIDPNDKYSYFENREKLISIYGDKLDCTSPKKTYSTNEYLDLIFGDLSKETYKQEQSRSSTGSVVEAIMLILWCIAMWRIFIKAGKPGIISIIPMYNLYELSDIAGLSGFFKKAFICLCAGILVSLFVPILGALLIFIFVIFIYVVNYNVARNFGWSVFASVLYVIFNPIAVFFLAFGNNEYYITEQKEELRKIELEGLVAQGIKDKQDMEQNVGNIDEDLIYDASPKEEIKIKYIDPNNIVG